MNLVRSPFEPGATYAIAVAENQADDVVDALRSQGWHVLSRVYGLDLEAIDSLQVALLEVSTLPEGAPVRVAVELSASAAILSAPDRSSRPNRSRRIAFAVPTRPAPPQGERIQ